VGSNLQNKAHAAPMQAPGSDPRLHDAMRYCRSVARSHYENFIVGSILIPRRLMPHLYSIYAFCRHADDLADEVGDPEQSLALLDEWRLELRRCYHGSPNHPIMIALQATIQTFDIPPDPFEDLISAFEQDCRVSSYETFSDLLDYCRRSANPVGRLFLWLFGYRDAERQQLSDKICTGLQLVNFWQDVVSDLARGRVYIPQEDMDAFGCGEKHISTSPSTTNFVRMMQFEVRRTEEMFASASVLAHTLDRRLCVDVELFRRSGLAVLGAIRKNGYDVISQRPRLSKTNKVGLLLRCLFMPTR
jgi:squalene synthase HpnC